MTIWRASIEVGPPPPRAPNMLRLLRELARAGVAAWRGPDGRVELAAVSEPPAMLVQMMRVAAPCLEPNDLLLAPPESVFAEAPKPPAPAVPECAEAIIDIETYGPSGFEAGDETYIQGAEILCAIGMRSVVISRRHGSGSDGIQAAQCPARIPIAHRISAPWM